MANEPWDQGIKSSLADLARSMKEGKARGWPYGAYGDSLQLLEAMEDRLAKGRMPKLAKRYVWVPLNLLVRGLAQMFIAYGTAFSIVFLLAFAAMLFTLLAPFEISPLIKGAALYANLVVWFTVVFAAPSTYCSAGTNAKHIETVTRKLWEWKVSDKKRTELISQNIRVFEQRVTRRLLVFRWLLGTGWTLYWSPVLADVIKTWAGQGVSLMQMVVLFEPIAWLVAFYVLTEGYARGVDILFRCLELGLNERIVQIEEQQASGLR